MNREHKHSIWGKTLHLPDKAKQDIKPPTKKQTRLYEEGQSQEMNLGSQG